MCIKVGLVWFRVRERVWSVYKGRTSLVQGQRKGGCGCKGSTAQSSATSTGESRAH